jgi:hypothetical protein
MARTPTKRTILLAVPGALLSGCLRTDRSEPTQTTPATIRNRTMSPTDSLDDLPEPRPLAQPLPGLVRADDREAYARSHDLEYREGTVKVTVELTPDGEVPEEHFQKVQGSYGRSVVGYVDIDRLVDLATHGDVRIVKAYADPRTDA